MAEQQSPDAPHTGMQEAQINRALGVFLLFFAAVVMISIFFTETTIGKLTNLGAGGIIGLIGGLMFYRAHASTKKPEG
jgi:hypothetical protein